MLLHFSDEAVRKSETKERNYIYEVKNTIFRLSIVFVNYMWYAQYFVSIKSDPHSSVPFNIRALIQIVQRIIFFYIIVKLKTIPLLSR